MSKIGLIGGLSYESTLVYYKNINQLFNRQLGKTHSAKIFLNSLDNEEVLFLVNRNDLDGVKDILIEAAQIVETAGASCLLMCCNSVHKVAEEVQKSIKIPLIHICDAVVEKIKESGLRKIGLIGTNFTMSDSFYSSRLEENSIQILLPDQKDRDYVHKAIFEELVKGECKPETKKNLLKIMDQLIDRGAEGIILGCTELPLIIAQEEVQVPVFDTTSLHIEKAVEFALQQMNNTDNASSIYAK